MILLAFEVDLNEQRCITFGVTPAAAKWRAVAAWREAGFGSPGEWPTSLTVVRRPDLDAFPLAERKAAWTEGYVRDLLEAHP